MKRERRYCQLVNGVSLMYFKEFGSKRDLHKKTAVWAPTGQRLPANMRATEIMHFMVLPDAHTPYGIPRWVNQIPSRAGLAQGRRVQPRLFDNGGVPPVMILLQGGTLQAETRSGARAEEFGPRLEEQPRAGPRSRAGRAAALTRRRRRRASPSSASARERQKDSMFEEYDERCEERVRRSFRLPPIFVGDEKSYTFATAFASYVVAEAQVFKPEREAFDEIISMRLLPVLGYAGYKMRSNALVIEDATLKLQGLEVIQGMGNQVEPADIVDAVNDIAGLHLKVSEAAPDLKTQMAQQQAAQNAALQQPPGAGAIGKPRRSSL